MLEEFALRNSDPVILAGEDRVEGSEISVRVAVRVVAVLGNGVPIPPSCRMHTWTSAHAATRHRLESMPTLFLGL